MNEEKLRIGCCDDHEDQATSPMPKTCMRWPCSGSVTRDDRGYMTCRSCGGSYGKCDQKEILIQRQPDEESPAGGVFCNCANNLRYGDEVVNLNVEE